MTSKIDFSGVFTLNYVFSGDPGPYRPLKCKNTRIRHRTSACCKPKKVVLIQAKFFCVWLFWKFETRATKIGQIFLGHAYYYAIFRAKQKILTLKKSGILRLKRFFNYEDWVGSKSVLRKKVAIFLLVSDKKNFIPKLSLLAEIELFLWRGQKTKKFQYWPCSISAFRWGRDLIFFQKILKIGYPHCRNTYVV